MSVWLQHDIGLNLEGPLELADRDDILFAIEPFILFIEDYGELPVCGRLDDVKPGGIGIAPTEGIWS